jgi:hypothetical protein
VIRTYPASRYDEHLMLKVPAMLWLAMVFLVRDLALLAVTFLPTSGSAIEVLRDYVEPIYLVADLPALVVLLLAMRRRPGAPPWMRKAWRAGRHLLLASAALHIGLWTAHFGAVDHWNLLRLNEGVILLTVLDVAILFYLARSPLVADLFQDTPRRDAG